jgi:TetR/AcrR family transcriptional regulator, fatty acid metabolism regulator protein
VAEGGEPGLAGTGREGRSRASRAASPSGADPGKRQRILDAAVRTFGRRGYHDAKIAEIASAARVAEGTVYLYFRNKEDLFATVFDEKMDDLLARGREIVRSEASAADRLTRLVDLHLTYLAADRDLALLFQIELRRSARMLQRVIRSKLVDYFRLLGGVLKDGIESGEFRAQLSPRLAVRVLFGAADEIVSEWLFSGEPALLTDARKVVGMLLSGFAERGGRREPGGRPGGSPSRPPGKRPVRGGPSPARRRREAK